MHLFDDESPGVLEDEGVGEGGKEAGQGPLDLRVAPLHQGGHHVEEVRPRLLHLDGPKAGPEHQGPDGVADDGAQHVQVLLGDALRA